MVTRAALIAEYEQAAQAQRALVDVRFKLLAFVPTITGISIGVLKDQFEAAFGLAAFGLTITLGIVIYEIRNSQLHDLAVHHQKVLRQWLGMPPLSLIGDRPARPRLFGLLSVWHDRALGIIYGACTGAWIGLIAFASFDFARRNPWVLLAPVALVFVAIYEEIIRINERTKSSIGPVPPAPEIEE